MENFRAGLRAAPPRAGGTASSPRASPAVDLRPVPDPEDLMRAACSAFTADRLDVYEFLERMDAIRLPRLVFGAAKWRRMSGDSDALNTTRTTPTGRARVSAACAFGRAAAEAAPNASTSATRPRVAMRAAPLLARLLLGATPSRTRSCAGAVAWTAPIRISGFVTRLGAGPVAAAAAGEGALRACRSRQGRGWAGDLLTRDAVDRLGRVGEGQLREGDQIAVHIERVQIDVVEGVARQVVQGRTAPRRYRP